VGAIVAGLAIFLVLWVLRSFPSVSTGHYVLPDQRVVSGGSYGLVRHPLYVAAYLLWLAVAIGFGSLVALALGVLYVVPSYWICMRAEEDMLLEQQVGMLFPRGRDRQSAWHPVVGSARSVPKGAAPGSPT
jgi:protein-S-isoprenylcysteine O-methyltransferase Ste14